MFDSEQCITFGGIRNKQKSRRIVVYVSIWELIFEFFASVFLREMRYFQKWSIEMILQVDENMSVLF